MPYNSLFNGKWGHLQRKASNIHTRGGLNMMDDYLVYRSEKLLKVNDSYSAFINDMRADGMNYTDILEILEMMRKGGR